MGRGRSAAQAFQILEIASMRLRAGGDKRLGVRIGAGETRHPMARLSIAQTASNRDQSWTKPQ